MTTNAQKARALQFRHMHHGSTPLVLPNAWDAASARIYEQVGFRAIATTSSGVAAALGYPDGEHISRDMLVEIVERITRVVACPLSVDLEAGYGDSIEQVQQTVKAIIAAGAVGINIEDSTKRGEGVLVDIAYQVDLLKAIQETAAAMDIPLVINARTDVFLLSIGESGDTPSLLEQAVQRGRAYRQAGADCIFPIGVQDASTIGNLVRAINAPINIMGGPNAPSIAELGRLGVARVSFASGPMRAVLAHLRRIAEELLESGTYTTMSEEMLSIAEFRKLFETAS